MTNRLESNPNMKLIEKRKIWTTYYEKNSYIKLLPEESLHQKLYKEILDLLSKEEYQINGMPKILEQITDQNRFIAYRTEEMPGVHLHTYMKESKQKLYDFYKIALTLIPIIENASKKNIVIKDIITEGNTLYDYKTNQASVIDIDGMQVENKTDTLVREYIRKSKVIYETILKSSKYQKNSKIELWNASFNTLLFYELFLNTVFAQSLFHYPLEVLFQIPNIKEKDLKIEKTIECLLNYCGIPKSNNIYGRILDLIRLNVPNSIDIHDFEQLANLTFDNTRKRIIH